MPTDPQLTFLLFTLLLGTGLWLTVVRPRSRGNERRIPEPDEAEEEHLRRLARRHAKTKRFHITRI